MRRLQSLPEHLDPLSLVHEYPAGLGDISSRLPECLESDDLDIGGTACLSALVRTGCY
jgi:hypothetical protein